MTIIAPPRRRLARWLSRWRLPYEDALALLSRAGFTLSHSSKFDVIVEYCLLNNIYDINQVNMVLYEFDQQLLG